MKTFKYFREQVPDQESATDAPEKENSLSNQLKSKENRQKMIKKQVLLKKLQAVRAGAHKGIVAHYEPEGEMVEGWLTKKKPEKKAQKAMDAGARARRKVARRVHAKYVSGSEDLVPDDIREGMVDVIKKGAKRHAKAVEKKKIKNRKAVPYAALAAQHEPEGELVEGKKKGLWDNIHAKRKRGEKPAKPGDKDYPKTLNVEGLEKARKNVGADKCWDGYKAKGTKKKGGKEVPNCVKEGDVHSGQGEKIQKRTKAWMDKKGMKGAPGLDAMKARTAEHKAKRGVKEEIVTEADPRLAIYQSGMTDASRVKGRVGKAVDKVKDKVKKVLGKKDKVSSHLDRYRFQSGLDNYLKSKVKKEDKAYDYVVSQLKKKYGDGVLTKRDKIKPQSPAEKAKVRAHQAKVDKENAAERAKDPSQGRYPKGYSNRGSD